MNELDQEREALAKLCAAVAEAIVEMRGRLTAVENGLKGQSTFNKQVDEEIREIESYLSLLEAEKQSKPTFKSPTDDLDAQLRRGY